MFRQTVALDPEPGMLREGRRRCHQAGIDTVDWDLGAAEEIPSLAVGSFHLVVFGQSFHGVRQTEITDIIFDLLEPGGSWALISNAVDRRPQPNRHDYPSIPHAAIKELIVAYLGEGTRHYLANWKVGLPARFEVTLADSPFGGYRTVYAPGRPDLLRDVDTVVANTFSMSYSAPRLYGDRRDDFEAELRQLLLGQSPAGLSWDWPGDTEVVIATKP